MAETNSLQEHLGRVQLMAAGDPTWDLSENDMVALTAVLSALSTQPVCLTCGGQPQTVGACICGGLGTAVAEREGLRLACFELETALATTAQERDALRTKIEAHMLAEQEALNADCATDPCAAYHRGAIWAFKTVLSAMEQKT